MEYSERHEAHRYECQNLKIHNIDCQRDISISQQQHTFTIQSPGSYTNFLRVTNVHKDPVKSIVYSPRCRLQQPGCPFVHCSSSNMIVGWPCWPHTVMSDTSQLLTLTRTCLPWRTQTSGLGCTLNGVRESIQIHLKI